MENMATVNINLEKLIDICSNGRKTKEELLEKFNIINDKNIHEIFKYRKFNDGFSDKVTCYNDGSKIIGTINPSYTEFLNKIFDILNVNPNLRYLIGKDDQDLEDVLKARIEILRNLPDEAALQNEFPILYKDLQDGRKYINAIRKRLRELDKDKTLTPLEIMAEKEKLKKDEKSFYRCALSPAFDSNNKQYSFVDKQVELYTRFVNERKQYKDLSEKNNYNKFIKKNFDIDKVALYVVNGYLKAIDANKDRSKKLKYYKLVVNFLKSPNVKRDKEIVVDGIIINYYTILNKAKQVYKQLNRVDIELNTKFLPTGSGYIMVGNTTSTKRKVKMSQEEIDKLTKTGREEIEHYMYTDYIAKVIGMEKFAGYLAYIYDNGVVILDKDFKEKYPTTAEGAIYVMNAKHFELLCGIGKTDLIYNPLLLDHIYHKGDWQTKVDKYINSKGTKEDKEEAKKLVKRLQEQSKKNI